MSIFDVGVFIDFEEVLRELRRVVYHEVVFEVVLNFAEHLVGVDLPAETEHSLAWLDRSRRNKNFRRATLRVSIIPCT